MLGNVLLLCFFVFFIFGIIGVQLWSGLLRNRCFLELPDNISLADRSVSPLKHNNTIALISCESGITAVAIVMVVVA